MAVSTHSRRRASSCRAHQDRWPSSLRVSLLSAVRSPARPTDCSGARGALVEPASDSTTCVCLLMWVAPLLKGRLSTVWQLCSATPRLRSDCSFPQPAVCAPVPIARLYVLVVECCCPYVGAGPNAARDNCTTIAPCRILPSYGRSDPRACALPEHTVQEIHPRLQRLTCLRIKGCRHTAARTHR